MQSAPTVDLDDTPQGYDPQVIEPRYIGPSVVPLPSVFDLIAAGLWFRPDEPRDTSNDVSDDQISDLL